MTSLAVVQPLSLYSEQRSVEKLPLGLRAFDAALGGFPRGAISELVGPESSGRMTMANTLLAAATRRGEVCAYVDTANSFDACSAAASGVCLTHLLWIRCDGNIEKALKVTDYLLHAGGFGAVVLDLCQVSDRHARRTPLSYWYRFRRALENTPAILAVLEREPLAKSCAGMILDLTRKKAVWGGAPGFHLLRDVVIEVAPRKPVRPATLDIAAYALA